MTDAYISLGGNLGDSAAVFRQALKELHQPPHVIVGTVSSFHQTMPVGSDAGAVFLNAAVGIETTLTPRELLNRLQAIETVLGRVRTIRWGPRTLDLDLVLFGNELIDEGTSLQVPHPACWYRRFVLDPLAEIASEVIHPAKQRTIRELRERLLVRPLPVYVLGVSPINASVVVAIQQACPNAAIQVIRNPVEVPTHDAGLLVRLPGAASLPWVDALQCRSSWLDATSLPGPPEQCLKDILIAAGLE